MSTLPAPLQGAVLGLAGFGFYACADVTVKLLGQNYQAMQVVFASALCSLPFILTQSQTLDRGQSLRPNLPGWTLVRIVLTLLNSVLVTYSFSQLPLAQSYAVFFCMPLLIAVLAVPLLGERLNLARGLIVGLGFCGVLVALQPASTPLQLAHLTALLGATLGALNALILRKIGGKESGAVMLLYPVLAQIGVLGAVMAFQWQPMPLAHWALAATIGGLGTLGGICIIAAYRQAPAVIVAPMQYSQIVWATALGIVLFGEKMSLTTAAGIAIIIAAGLLNLWRTRQEAAALV